jgi:hypothetical protein
MEANDHQPPAPSSSMTVVADKVVLMDCAGREHTTMLYTHVLNRGACGVGSPLDR